MNEMVDFIKKGNTLFLNFWIGHLNEWFVVFWLICNVVVCNKVQVFEVLCMLYVIM